MHKAFRYRIYPNAEQREMFAKTFGCVRFIYNKMLADKIEHYKVTGEMLQTTPAMYKDEFPWLREVDSLALANAQINLQKAYANFFSDPKIGFPKFKSKKSAYRSYTTNNQKGSIRIEGKHIRLPIIGMVKVALHRQIPSTLTIKSATVTQEPSGKYFVSVLTEADPNYPCIPLDPKCSVGLDYSSPHFYVSSDGVVADMPHFYREAEAQLAREQRKLSRMVKGSANYRKQKRKVACLHEKIRNCRLDFLHKESRRLADSYDYICLEDINMKNMSRGLSLGKATMDNGFGLFRTFLTYKMRDLGKQVITIDKWFPSSKTCSNCGHINHDLTLKDRHWRCPNCGVLHDRDVNAACCIKIQGMIQVCA